jgi:hypothetical protein
MNTFLSSFLFLYVTLTALYLGSLSALCFRVIYPAEWIEPMLPALKRAQKLRWVLFPGFFLLALAVPALFPWAGIEKNLYLTRTGFLLRGIVYWISWLLLSRAALREHGWAGGPGFVLLLFSGTFASVDWILSLEAGFKSTIFGLIFLLSSVLLAFGYAFPKRSSFRQRQDQGSVHLALVCTWTYLVFIQFLVIWSGNLPDEVQWYHLRSEHGWQIFPLVFALLQFFAPFFLLLLSKVKRSAFWSGALSGTTIFSQVVFLFWQIKPEFSPHLSFTWADLLALFLLFLYFWRERHAEA